MATRPRRHVVFLDKPLGNGIFTKGLFFIGYSLTNIRLLEVIIPFVWFLGPNDTELRLIEWIANPLGLWETIALQHCSFYVWLLDYSILLKARHYELIHESLINSEVNSNQEIVTQN